MGKLKAKYSLWVLIIILSLSGCEGCLEEERLRLLDIKAYLKLYGVKIDHVLSSWIADPAGDCCNWGRVKCNATSGRVVELSLNNTSLSNFHQMPEKLPLVNMSVFLPFEELKYLDLSENWFAGCLENHGFDKLRSLKKMEVLNIGQNNFDNRILPSLGLLTSLRTLNLGYNKFEGSSISQELAALSNLETLDLSGFRSFQPLKGLERLSDLKTLLNLRLDANGFDNGVFLSISGIKSLKNLSLGGNNLKGSLPCKELGNLENLEMLDLTVNALSDYPTNARDCNRLKKLTTLMLDFNNLDNSIVPFLSVFTSLETLSLLGNKFQTNFPLQELAALRNLKFLDLTYNNISDTIASEGMSEFKNLETLNLAGCWVTKSFVQSLGAVTSLKNLDLSLNWMQGGFPSNITRLTGLEKLDLHSNFLDGTLPASELAKLSNLKFLNLNGNGFTGPLKIEELAKHSNLEVLDLSNNLLYGYVSPSIRSMASLKALSLANNKLDGSLPQTGFCDLKNLQELDLSQNNFSGTVPPCVSRLTSLRLLDLSSNQFQGNTPSSLTSTLEYIDLSHNLFHGSFSLSSFDNLTNLRAVMLRCDNSNLKVETGKSSSWIPKFQLTILAIRNCDLNRIPEFLSHQFDLTVVDLSHNNLTGLFPNWLLENNINLDFLSLRNNSLFGQFHLSLNSSSDIFLIDISDNHFHGQLQENIGKMLPKVSALNISENAFEGSISSVRNMPNMLFLDLSSNRFSGEVKDRFAENCSNLLYLKLSNNRLHGRLPNLNLSSLYDLHLNENQFIGPLPDGMLWSPLLSFLDISANHLSGEIPRFSVNHSMLLAVNMRDNAFEGKISCELLTSAFLLELSHNYLSGSLPSCDFSNLLHLNLQGNKLRGSIPRTLFNSSYLLTLNLKSNLLSGEIPNSVVAYSDLRVLLLGENLLSGFIPDQLCQFKNMNILDLSKNSFSGSIPHCFSNITFGSIKEYESKLGESWNTTIPRSTRYKFEGLLERDIIREKDIEIIQGVEVEFLTKFITTIYKGSILDLMSGLDLSCNRLTGEIPPELGKLSWIHALNLSHNQLTGSIPSNLSNLRQIESLDLSYNNLSGEIPTQLVGLNFLGTFDVSYNNLSGEIPDQAQFGTYDESRYRGNPGLCGRIIHRSCKLEEAPNINEEEQHEDDEEDKGGVDMTWFYWSFASSYVTILMGTAAILWINRQWRMLWFHYVDQFIHSLSGIKIY